MLRNWFGCGGSAILGALALVSVGCSVTALEERAPPIAVNRCESDDDCGAGHCSAGLCVASRGELSTLLFELTPTANGGELSGVSFFHSLTDLPLAGGVVDLPLDAVTIKGSILAEPRPHCSPTFQGNRPLPIARDSSVPARVTFTPALRTRGLPLSARAATLETHGPEIDGRPSRYGFHLVVPAGAYDVDVEPYPVASDAAPAPLPAGCAFPPQLIRGLCVENEAELVLPLAVPTRLRLSVSDREQRLDNWVADIVDSVTGKPISTRVALSLPSTSGGISEYSVDLDFLPVIEYRDCEQQQSSAEEFVRLSPPPDVLAPTVLFRRTALGLFTSGVARIDRMPELSKPVVVEGHVFSGPDRTPTGATLVFIARSLSGVPEGVFASFTRTVVTNAEGRFEVTLLPGTYDVHAAPGDGQGGAERFRTTKQAVWEVAPTPAVQAGRAVELASAIRIVGAAAVPGGREGARGASVVAEASAFTLGRDVLARSLDEVRLEPRATTATITDTAGNFVLSADEGTFDFSVRPPEGSGLPWLVAPKLELAGDTEVRQLPPLELPWPVALKLRTSIDGDALDPALLGARLRAFAPVDADGVPISDSNVAHALVPVAEGRVDMKGSATLLVPASLHPIRSEPAP